MQSSGERVGGEVNYAALRWATAVVPVATAPVDVRTVGAWARFIGVSTGALRAWCRAAGERPKASLDFARLIRAIQRAPSNSWNLMNLLDVVDDRTLRRLFKRCGMPMTAARPTLPAFVDRQLLVVEESNRRAFFELLNAAASEPSRRVWSTGDANREAGDTLLVGAKIRRHF